MSPSAAESPIRLVVMGVSGCGKSTVARALADRFDVTYIEGDDLHPAASIAKMTGGVPLTDEDRMPWLAIVGQSLASPLEGAVASCSALRRRYRDAIRAVAPDAVFLHLDVSPEELEVRLNARVGHFMTSVLLASQLATLEPLEPDEDGIVVPADHPDAVIAAAISALSARLG